MFRDQYPIFEFQVILAVLLLSGCGAKEPVVIVPETGYEWPDNDRDYWPTEGWRL